MPNTRLAAPLLAALLPLAGPCFSQNVPESAAAPTVPVADARGDTEAPGIEALGIVRAATARIGGDDWSRIRSFESVASARSALGDARIEYRFVAPDARTLVQTMPGGRGVIEMGVVDGKAWMGEPGNARAIDPKIAQEMAGGGDLQTLVHSIEARFESFTAKGRAVVGGRDAWRIEMTPRASALAGMPASTWTLWIDAMNSTILGLDIPAPTQDAAAGAPTPGAQTIRFSDWRPVELPKDAKPGRLLCFGKAEIESDGMKVVLEFERVAVDTLEAGSIAPPASVAPAKPSMHPGGS